MKSIRLIGVLALLVSLISMVGCGISKDKYDALLEEKVALEEKVIVLTKARDALKKEYDNLLKEKMDLATANEIMVNEKNALKEEYDKLLDEKITIKAAYDKLLAENKDLRDSASRR